MSEQQQRLAAQRCAPPHLPASALPLTANPTDKLSGKSTAKLTEEHGMVLRLLHGRRHGAARPFAADLALAVFVLAVQTTVVLLVSGTGGDRPDLLGWALLTGAVLPLPWRRRAPLLTLLAVFAFVLPYHAIGYLHLAGIFAALLALYTLAAAGPPLRTVLVVASVFVTVAVLMLLTPEHDSSTDSDMLRSLGWVVAVPVCGEMIRIHRRYIAAVVERAERAERTREEEAARRVTEERLRIARDLHDLLAHSITLIGVQTSVAAHVLIADPEKLDRDAIATALDGIADTCRDARVELRTTLRVLRGGDGSADGAPDPLPNLDGLPDLVRIARSAGAEVDLAVRLDPAGTLPGPGPGAHTGPAPGAPPLAPPVTATAPAPAPVAVPAAIGAAAYRIVQESLTNAVRHAGPRVRIRVAVRIERTRAFRALRVTVTDTGPETLTGGEVATTPARSTPPTLPPHPEPEAPSAGGFGIVGMRERARTVGGTLETVAHPQGGFTVTAVLPLDGRAPQEESR